MMLRDQDFFHFYQKKYPTLHLVHRLDKETSGVVIFAKSASIASELGHLFKNHQIEKYYLALSMGRPKKKQGTIKGDIVKSRRSQYKLLRSHQKPSITQFFSYSLKENVRLFLLKPITGKTHQIRVVMNSLSSPILGDYLYGGANSKRMHLHCFLMQFSFRGEKYQLLDENELKSFTFSELIFKKLHELGEPSMLKWPKL
jgi:tRNA pseudouridine32 synthase/23S rRNA pseudouridine746 synthase